MTHHHEEEEKNIDYLYYLVGLLSGAATGFVLDVSLIWLLALALFGLLFAGFFVTLLVKGREQA
jgi:hypothetical protein